MQSNSNYRVGLYLRLSSDDETDGESISIRTQRDILTNFCHAEGYGIYDTYIDDGYSGLNFLRPGFMRMIEDIEKGIINMVITKDLSRLGRDYIMTGYYSEIYFPSQDVRYIALADDFDTAKGTNDIAPFKNILNDLYARDLSKKIKAAKHQRAKQGLFVGSQAPYGYMQDPKNRNHLIVDHEAAENVKLIFSLALTGMGSVAIATELKNQKVLAPSVYKYQHGDTRFSKSSAILNNDLYAWHSATVGKILRDPVYTGQLTSLKTECIDCKTKRTISIPTDQRIITEGAHEAIISIEVFNSTQKIRSQHPCPADKKRFNLFRGKLFCECCGHPLTISKQQLLARTTDMYLCMHHYNRPDVCPQTHRIYHDMLYDYVLQQIRQFAKTMKKRKVNTPIATYSTLTEITPEVLNNVIERIEIGHLTNKSKPGKVIQIYWNLS